MDANALNTNHHHVKLQELSFKDFSHCGIVDIKFCVLYELDFKKTSEMKNNE